MITEFLEGETYTNPKQKQDIMVLGIHSDSVTEVKLAVLWVDRETTETTNFGDLTVLKTEFADWSVVSHD